ncbi:MAG: rubrerythrin [Lachnospiraceae bacterium]|nr:rubrerythrin [Lachnospiraceae bacterium]
MANENPNEVEVTTYDKVMAAWHHCMYLTKLFETYYHETHQDKEAAKLFEKAANGTGDHAAVFREWLLTHQKHK